MLYWLSISLALIPGFSWLIFWRDEDPRPESKAALVRTFFFGGAFAFLALVLQIFLKSVFANYGLDGLALPSIIAFALIEELCKFLATYVSIHEDPAFNEPVDAMLYMIVAALGFATVENLGAIGGQPAMTVAVTDIFHTTALRFLGATLLHTLASALVGYYWAVGILKRRRGLILTWGFTLAVALHSAFNYFIIIFRDLSYPLAFVITAGFFIITDYERLNNDRINMSETVQ